MHVWFLQKILGRMKAAELIFTGEILKAKQAEEMGLVTKVVPSSKLTMATEELARKIIMMSPLAIKRTKELLYKMEDLDFAAVPEEAAEALSSAFSSNDSKEARKAFLEKRKPVWTGT
jgi:enoyl-CoA hydratase/carnithine racemase